MGMDETAGAGRFARVASDERQGAIETMIVAFTADPVIRWFYSEPWRYLGHFGDFIQAFGGQAFDEGTAWRLDGSHAAAIWLSPQSQLDEAAIVDHFRATVAPEKLDDLLAVIEQMDAGHPEGPHWYLAWLGVDTSMQGHGLGDELLRRCLEIIDRDHVPVYLDNTNPRNIPFYERHGFRVTGESQAGSCPPLFGMLRGAR
jgi:ribosomal protein S18 acetylase RimI-like enzyme